MTFGVFSYFVTEERIFWDDIPEPYATQVRRTVFVTVLPESRIPSPDFLLGIERERWNGRDLSAHEAVKLAQWVARLYRHGGFFHAKVDLSHIPTARWAIETPF